MSTGIDSQHGAAEMPMELAHRAGDGIEVLLFWDRGDSRLKVVVDDRRTGGSFELAAADGNEALEAFYHPFACAAARGIRFHSEPRGRGASDAVEPTAPTSTGRYRHGLGEAGDVDGDDDVER
jgi:hypothetical protein